MHSGSLDAVPSLYWSFPAGCSWLGLTSSRGKSESCKSLTLHPGFCVLRVAPLFSELGFGLFSCRTQCGAAQGIIRLAQVNTRGKMLMRRKSLPRLLENPPWCCSSSGNLGNITPGPSCCCCSLTDVSPGGPVLLGAIPAATPHLPTLSLFLPSIPDSSSRSQVSTSEASSHHYSLSTFPLFLSTLSLLSFFYFIYIFSLHASHLFSSLPYSLLFTLLPILRQPPFPCILLLSIFSFSSLSSFPFYYLLRFLLPLIALFYSSLFFSHPLLSSVV